MTELLTELRSLLRKEGDLVRVDVLAFHALCVDARARFTVAEFVGRAFHELEKLPYRVGVKEGSDWLLPADVVEALIARGLGESLTPGAAAALVD